MPLVPRHMLKVFADIQLTSAFGVDVDVMGVSGSFARGNENNLHEPDGTLLPRRRALHPATAWSIWVGATRSRDGCS